MIAKISPWLRLRLSTEVVAKIKRGVAGLHLRHRPLGYEPIDGCNAIQKAGNYSPENIAFRL
jgi:hypothetical protein